MIRRLVGIYDPQASVGAAPPPAGLSSWLSTAPLRLACDGDDPVAVAPVCLLDGFLDNRESLARELGLPADVPAESLLARAYREWGERLAVRLRGDFTVVIWDSVQRRGLIARDQLGVRCIYLQETAGVVRFANELSLLLESLPCTPAPDRASVAHWIAASRRPGSFTLYEGVRRLDPGCVLVLEDGRACQRAYWRPRYRPPRAIAREDAVEEVRAALARSVGRRLHGATGVLMSGGLDSSAVAAIACERASDRVAAYAGVFPDHPAVDESALIDVLRERLRLGGLDARVAPGGLVHSAIVAASRWRVPLLGWGDFWTVPLLRAAAGQGISTVLGGDGGDEVFAASPYLLADLLRRGRPLQAWRAAKELPGAGDHPPTREVASIALSMGLVPALPFAAGAARVGARRGSPRWLLARAARELRESDDPAAWMRLDGPRWWAHVAHGLTRGIEETGIFEHQRQRAALAGLQARHPLLDLDLVELVLGLAPELSFDRHRSRPLLRAATKGLLPDDVRLRAAKAWFDSLIVDSLTGPDAAAVSALLADPRAQLGSYVDVGSVAALLEQGPPPGAGRFAWMHHVWRLLTAECWLRTLAGDSLEGLSCPTPDVSLVEPLRHSNVFQS